MAAPAEFLEKIKQLNNEKKYQQVIDLLPEKVLEDYKDADLYAEAAQAYCRIGKNEYLQFAEQALKINPKQAKAWYYLGVAFYLIDKQYDKAVEAYNKAIEIDPKFYYPYNGLGNLYLDRYEYDKAIEAYNKAIEIDPEFDSPYYNLATHFYSNKQYKQAKQNFEKFVVLTIDDDSIYRRYAKDKIEEINKLMDDEAFVEISELVNKIKSTLLFTEDCITHYTTMTALGFLVLKKSPQRLSEGAYLNDTSEGRELFKYLGFEEDIRKGQDTEAETFAVKPFIGSFVADNKHDDLTLWRMYGKEEKDEARGCSITMKREILIEKIKEKLLDGKPDGNLSIKNDLQFYRVAYRDKDTVAEPFLVPGKGVTNDIVTTLNKDMVEIKLKVTAYEADRKDKPSDRQKLKELLNEIAYLFKSVEYQYEHEVRLIIKGIGFDKIVDPSVTPPKVYIELVPIAPAIKKITLGPKVERPDEWASALYYTLDKDLPDKKDKAEILISHLPYK